jgi:hypothetical protein
MKLNVMQVLKTLSGQTMKDQDEQGQAMDATLRMAICNALLAPTQREEKGTEKLRKYELARKVFTEDTPELAAEDVALMKERILAVFPPLIAGQTVRMLEGAEV